VTSRLHPPGYVNADKTNPLRLAAVAAGKMYYSTGVACFRGHVGERYAVSGRCVKCTKEDKATWWNKDTTGHNKKKSNSPGAKRRARMRQLRRQEFYKMLVANGYPERKDLPMGRRIAHAWRAFKELSGEQLMDRDPAPNALTIRCLAIGLREIDVTAIKGRMSKGMTFEEAVENLLEARRGRHQRAAAEQQRRVRYEARQRELRDLRLLAEIIGVDNPKLFIDRVRRGKSHEEAAQPEGRFSKYRKYRRLAAANNIKWETARARVQMYGWDWERAVTAPVNPKPRIRRTAERALAAEHGIPWKVVRRRMHNRPGVWTWERACTTPHTPRPRGPRHLTSRSGSTINASDNVGVPL
jgi:hypothetical protein